VVAGVIDWVEPAKVFAYIGARRITATIGGGCWSVDRNTGGDKIVSKEKHEGFISHLKRLQVRRRVLDTFVVSLVTIHINLTAMLLQTNI